MSGQDEDKGKGKGRGRSVTFSVPRPRGAGLVLGVFVGWLYFTRGAEAAPEWFWLLAVVTVLLSLVA